MIKKRLCIFLLLELLSTSILTGCRTAEHNTDPSFKNFDVEYTINDDGTYTCSDHTYKHKVEVSGIEGELPVTFVVLTNNITPTNIRLKFPESKESCRLPLLY